jgi:transposase
VKLTGSTKPVNRDLEAKSRALAGFKAYITNMVDPDPETVIGAYHQLWRIEASFRMSKHDLQARPTYHRKRESIEAHLSVVFAALAITRPIEDRTGWSMKKCLTTTQRYRTVQIRLGSQVLTAEDPLPPELHDALALIN